MDTQQTLGKLIGDYPKLWDFIDNNNDIDKSRSVKFSRRYPLSIDALSNILEFHLWVRQTSKLISKVLYIQSPANQKHSDSGPDPSILEKLNWFIQIWDKLESIDKSLSKLLNNDIIKWQRKIGKRIGDDTNTYTYETAMVCDVCKYNSVMKYKDFFLCVNIQCKDPLTGEWRTWQ